MMRSWSSLSIRCARSSWAVRVLAAVLVFGSARPAGAQITFATLAGHPNIASADGTGAG
jgi:hypothetical protein